MPFVDPEVPPNVIAETRATFLKELETKGESVIHPKDLEKIKNDDYYIKRFLMHNDVDKKLSVEMLWESLIWRKEYGVNDFDEASLRMDLVVEGIFFVPGRDRDGHPIFVFKCRKHTRGKNIDDIKRIIVYWIERLERQEKGRQITMFFDMDGCGVSNMDLELTKYLISVFKQYYPYMLNYIIVFEMQWILNAGFKIIKTWLPAKAIERLKVIKKPDLFEFVDPSQAMTCWGGNNDFVFNFLPAFNIDDSSNNNNTNVNRKVHFAEGSVDSSAADITDAGMLSVTPSNTITFLKEGNDLISTVQLKNVDSNINLSYKMKTTSPEKFKVRPSSGFLTPGASVTIQVTLLQGFQLGGLSKDKFLVMSMPVESVDLNNQELADLWKNASNKHIEQHRLRCVQQATNEPIENGSAVSAISPLFNDNTHFSQIAAQLTQLTERQTQLHRSLRRAQILLWVTFIFVFGIGAFLAFIMKGDNDGFCFKNDEITYD